MTTRVPELQNALPEALLEMHDEDAAALGVTDGNRVRVTSRFGSVEIAVSTAKRTAPPKGMTFAPFFQESALINLAVQDYYCPLSKEPDFKKTCVRIEKV
jgi:nitrate reductase NapA